MNRADPGLADKARWNAVAAATGSLSRLLAGLIVARLLGPELNGRYAFVLWLVEMLVMFFNAGLPAALNRFLALSLGRADWAAARQMVRLGVAAGAILALAAALATLGAAWFRPLTDTALLTLAFPLALLAAAQLGAGIAQAILTGLHDFRAYARAVAVGSIFLLFAQIAGVYGWGLEGAIYGALIGQAATALLAVIAVARGASSACVSPSPAAAIERTAFVRYARDSWLAALISAVVWGRTELYFLERLSTAEQVGYFAVGLVFSAIIVQAVNLVSGILLPHFSTLVGAAEKHRLHSDYRRLTFYFALFTFPIAAIGIAVTPEIVALLLGPSYAGAIASARILMATGALAFATVGSAVVYGQGDAHVIRNWSLLGAVLLASLCTMLAPSYGASGAAAARIAVQAAMIGVGFRLLYLRYGLIVPVWDLMKLFFAASGSGLAALAGTAVVSSGLVAIALATFVGVFAYVFCLRWLRAVRADDAAVLQTVIGKVPAPLAKPCNALLRLTVAR